MQENLNPQENLFGQSEFTSKWDKNFDQIIEQLVNKHKQNFSIKEINEEISSKIESGCQINPSNIVILEPEPAPDSNTAIFKSNNMYLNDLKQDVIDLAYNAAIFARTKSYTNKDLTCRFIIGQWRTSKVMCSALITAFGGYSLYSMAIKLGVQFLDKLEQNVDYYATCKVLELIHAAIEIAIRFHLNSKNILLVVFVPLFPATGKNIYTLSVVTFLESESHYPQQYELFKHVASVNITRENQYLAFDEALE
ncbi:hypothetical protein F8M41_021676 [Gigaspora margarita]|uniref:Uncharacterized protein n=1 Tax=Gigaspora margarita TaxID=4874 RepID=A0A8H4AGD8_GIGMA|nr:hypothetical protein F8M41_021676 [Gigaspora margarita]